MKNEQEILTQINIGDILRLGLPLKTEVVASPQQTRRAVQWAVVLADWKNLDVQAHANDLTLIPPQLQKRITDRELDGRLQKLASMSVAGILFFDKVSDKIKEKAGSIGIPLLIVPPKHTVRGIHRDIISLLINRQSATSERGMQLYRKLSEMSREGKGMEAMTAVMSNLTGKIVVVQDKRMAIRTMSVPRNNTVDIDNLKQVISKRDLLPGVLRNRKAAARSRQAYWQENLPLEDNADEIGRVLSPIISGDRARGYVSVIGPANGLDLLDSQIVEHGAAACALEMAKEKAISEAKKELRGSFLEGLLAGTLPKKERKRLAARLDHDTAPPHAIMVFAWANEGSPSLRQLETSLNWILSGHNRPALVHIYSEHHVCVFQTLNNMDDMESARQLAKRLWAATESEFPNDSLLGGMSGPVENLDAWTAVYEEALQAMQLGQRLHLNQVVEFNSLGIYRLLAKLEDLDYVQEFMEEAIGPLIAYDEQHRSSLAQTMDAYFNHHGNVSQTAESLFIHRNTLLYRLDRIQELTGQNLSEANMRLAMQLALKLWQLRPQNS